MVPLHFAPMRNFILKPVLSLICSMEVLISDITIRRAVFNLSSDDNLPQNAGHVHQRMESSCKLQGINRNGWLSPAKRLK